MSIPSVIFADANWYGSLRGGVVFESDKDAAYQDYASRWGIKGSNEVSDGLSAVYNFEASISTANAKQGGRHAYVGLSGGFGTLRLGQSWGAAYNHTGAIRDIANWESRPDTLHSARFNAVSYSIDAGPVSMQLDAMMDGGKDTGQAVDGASFGMSIPLGDLGKVALGYETMEDSMMDVTLKGYIPAADAENNLSYNEDGTIKNFDQIVFRDSKTHELYDGTISSVKYGAGYKQRKVISADGITTLDGTVEIKKVDGAWYHDDAGCVDANNVVQDACKDGTEDERWYLVMVDDNAPEDTGVDGNFGDSELETPAKTYSIVNPNDMLITGTAKGTAIKDYGAKKSHISAQFGLGAVTLGLGYSTKDSNDPMKTAKAKITYLGASGGIGDTGLSWMAWGRKQEDHDGMETSPWAIGLTKALGGGAKTFIEHANDDDGTSRTNVAFRVDF